MAFCGNCGAQAQNGTKFCPSCGHATEGVSVHQAAGGVPAHQVAGGVPVHQAAGGVPVHQAAQPQQQPAVLQSDTEENKGMAILSYLIFFIPLLMGKHKTSPFVKYHVNQGTMLALIAIGYSIISRILSSLIKVEQIIWYVPVSVTPPWLVTVLWVISIPIYVCCIIGIINAVNGEMKPLPVIGDKFTIIK